MNYLQTKFQWYKNGIKTVKPSGEITLEQFINSVRNPKPEMREAFNLIQKAAQEGNKALKDELKTKHLFFTTPSCIVDPIRNYDSIKSFTNLCVIEYDNIPYAAELRDYIFEKQKSCIFAFNSPSGTGCKFIFYIQQPKDIEDYKSLFYGIAYDLDKFINLDLSTARVTQPLFCSWDEDAKFREDAVMSEKRGYKVNAFNPEDFIAPEPIENVSQEDVESCYKMVGRLIDRIEDSGHNQVLAAATVSGGLASNYSISVDEMWSFLEDRITENAYLSKDTKGYLRTARTMFNRGLQFPIPLTKND